MKIQSITDRTADFVAELTTLWERSVRVSHHFLGDEDIAGLRPFVRQGLAGISVLGVAFEGDCAVGFIGIADRKIEMLFVAPEYIGRGVGRSLLRWGVEHHDADAIDVNEQNPSALAVYKHWGFEAYERTETDEQGNPFPIIKMRLGKGKEC